MSNIFTKVDATILEALSRKGTTNAHGKWTAVFRRFIDMKFQLPHFQGGFGVTPNAGSAISAFYVASVCLVQWLGFCSHTEQNFIDLASKWDLGQDLANLDQRSAPILLALKQAQQVLLTEEWWSQPIDTLRLRRSYRRRNSRPCMRHPLFRLLRFLPALYL